MEEVNAVQVAQDQKQTAEQQQKFSFPFEQEAKRQEAAPDGLDLVDQMAFVTLRGIYKAYADKVLTAEKAGAEKQKLRRTWSTAKEEFQRYRKQTEFRAKILKETELARVAVLKDPTPENAIRLVNAIDGIKTAQKKEKMKEDIQKSINEYMVENRNGK